jgi:membrane protease subunit (stomatin/prohibitin family)
MARVFDVIEYPNEMKDELVHRFPESGAGDFRIGSQVIVRETQAAVFFRDGNALDVFGPGRHTITTLNIPLLIERIGKTFFQ